MRVLSSVLLLAAFLMFVTVLMFIGDARAEAEVDPVQEGLQVYYDRGLVSGHWVRKGVPYIEVSDLFLRLSDEDRTHILESISESVEFPEVAEGGMFVVKHGRTRQVLGVHTQAGMQ
jgi:hypothetical protein